MKYVNVRIQALGGLHQNSKMQLKTFLPNFFLIQILQEISLIGTLDYT